MFHSELPVGVIKIIIIILEAADKLEDSYNIDKSVSVLLPFFTILVSSTLIERCTGRPTLWGSAPDPARGACSAPADPWLYLMGHTSKGSAG